MQQCNCTSKGYKGLSKSIVETFPHANFYDRKNNSEPGAIEVRGDKKKKERFVVALYAQRNPGKAGKADTEKMRQKWFKSCLREL